MQKSEIVWRSDDDWKARYSKLYSSRRLSQPVEDPTRHISFMGRAIAPSKMLLMKAHAKRNSDIYGETAANVKPIELTALLSPQNRSSTSYAYSIMNTPEADNSIDTLLLEMVRAKSRENEEMQDKTLELRDDVSDDQSSEACVHGMSVRMTDRSISRRSMSRISRVSTRRDMDIPSLMAFTATVTPAPAPLEIPAFQKANTPSDEAPPRWSIRRSMCPVCSQKWKDKSSINNIKNSGLKRNSSVDLPTVIAPARLRSAITMEYNPRPALAAVDEKKYYGFMRNTKATWQLTRARRFRTPKLQMPSPEATAPPSSTAPMALKDLNTRVNRFLTDEGMDKFHLEASFTL